MCVTTICSGNGAKWNASYIDGYFSEVLRNTFAETHHRHLVCSTYLFHQITPLEWTYEFFGVSEKTRHLREFYGMATLKTLTNTTCMNVTPLSPQFEDGLITSIDRTTLCMMDGSEKGHWFLLADTSNRMTFLLVRWGVSPAVQTTAIERARKAFPNVTWFEVPQTCSYRSPLAPP